MGIERLGEHDTPDHDQELPRGGRPAETHYDPAERRAYWEQYRAAVEAVYPPTRPSWDAEVPSLREAWADHEKRWDQPERAGQSPQPDSSPGWHGQGDRHLDPDTNAEVDQGCDRIREVSENVITPAMNEIRAQDPDRSLIGLEYHLKGPDRLKEKIADDLKARPGLTAAQALSLVPDAIRFTFCYSDERYAEGVRADLQRLRESGFESAKPLKNSWVSDQYKGINAQLREPSSGQRFEVQFHTQASFEAKQLTHGAYERIRNLATSDTEHGELEDFQRQVCAKIPVPPGATEIIEHGRKDQHG